MDRRLSETRPEEKAKRAEYMRGWWAKNKHRKSVKEQRRAYSKANRDIGMLSLMKHALMSKYGMTPEELEQIKEDQNGLCNICGTSGDKRGLCVDHCHETGKIRSLLCHPCNLGLGNFNDDPKLLARAIEYLDA